ncbi:MAG TPA: tRNA (adenosine(37)-N6)-dimethylallyltransferase MiaA, partial [Legionella sp.]|nr:tRNA (adenosine(37)-N6)-dimethylallyltransferase MiaA [Legionella sp.]
YRQVFDYLNGDYNDITLCAKGTAATRQLAKRQLTWLRHWPGGYRFEAEDPAIVSNIIAAMAQYQMNSY